MSINIGKTLFSKSATVGEMHTRHRGRMSRWSALSRELVTAEEEDRRIERVVSESVQRCRTSIWISIEGIESCEGVTKRTWGSHETYLQESAEIRGGIKGIISQSQELIISESRKVKVKCRAIRIAHLGGFQQALAPRRRRRSPRRSARPPPCSGKR